MFNNWLLQVNLCSQKLTVILIPTYFNGQGYPRVDFYLIFFLGGIGQIFDWQTDDNPSEPKSGKCQAFDEYRGPEVIPGDHIKTDKEIENWVLDACETAYHPSVRNSNNRHSQNETNIFNEHRSNHWKYKYLAYKLI